MYTKYRNLKYFVVLLFVVGITLESSIANSWIQKTEIPTSRIGAAKAVVNGKIYLIGGITYSNRGGPGMSPLSIVEVYDTRTNTWHKGTDMPTPRSSVRGAAVDGKIYVFGGWNQNKVRGIKQKKIVEVYDPETDTWERKRDMTSFRSFGAAVVDGKVYAVGGSIFNEFQRKWEATDIVEVYDPATDRWKKIGKMPAQPKRESFSTAVANDNIYVIGGKDRDLARLGNQMYLASIEEYNPRTNLWRKVTDMPFLKLAYATASAGNQIYLIGGYGLDDKARGQLASVDVYDPVARRWDVAPPMLQSKTTTAVVVDSTIYVLGGFIGSARYSPIVEAFDTGFHSVDPRDKLSTTWGKLKKSN